MTTPDPIWEEMWPSPSPQWRLIDPIDIDPAVYITHIDKAFDAVMQPGRVITLPNTSGTIMVDPSYTITYGNNT